MFGKRKLRRLGQKRTYTHQNKYRAYYLNLSFPIFKFAITLLPSLNIPDIYILVILFATNRSSGNSLDIRIRHIFARSYFTVSRLNVFLSRYEMCIRSVEYYYTLINSISFNIIRKNNMQSHKT